MSEKTDIWLPIYAGDYLKDTSDLTLTEHGAYFKLMMAYWQRGCLEHCLEKCMRIAGAYTHAEQQAVATIVERFFAPSEGLLRNKRLDLELALARAKKDKAVGKARDAAKARWDAHSNATGMPQAMHEQCPSPSPSPSPLTTPAPTKSIGRKRQSTKRPDDWNFTEKHKELALSAGLNVSDQCQKFMDWHDSKGSIFADWDAAFRTWLRKSKDMQPAAGRHAGFDRRDYSEGVRDDGKF